MINDAHKLSTTLYRLIAFVLLALCLYIMFFLGPETVYLMKIFGLMGAFAALGVLIIAPKLTEG